MKIGFDAKRAVMNFRGLGNYSRFVINNMIKYYPENEYKLFVPRLPPPGTAGDQDGYESLFVLKNGRVPLWRSFGIVKDIVREKPDIYHGLSNELPFGIDCAGVRSIVTMHDLTFRRFPQFYPVIDRTIYDAKARYACKAADRIIAVSECTKRDIIEYYGTDPAKIDVVYQGCFSIFHRRATEEEKREAVQKYGLPDKYVLNVSSIEDNKNILLIVKALRQVPDIHFVAVGKKRKYAEKVIDYAERHGLSDRVHLISNVRTEDLPAVMQQAELFIFPSRYEGFGIPIIEALSSGVPVIVATGSCLEEAGGPHSVYVHPDDDQGLSVQINRLLNDGAARNEMIVKGLEYVKRFSDEACSRALMDVYIKTIRR